MTKTGANEMTKTRKPTRAVRRLIEVTIDWYRGDAYTTWLRTRVHRRTLDSALNAGWASKGHAFGMITPAGYAAIGREHPDHAEALAMDAEWEAAQPRCSTCGDRIRQAPRGYTGEMVHAGFNTQHDHKPTTAALDKVRDDQAAGSVNPAADPSWVAARDLAGQMTPAEADAYYAARTVAAEQPRRETVTATVKPARPAEQTKRGNYLLRAKDADRLMQAAQLVKDGHVQASMVHVGVAPVVIWVFKLTGSMVHTDVTTEVRALQRAGLVADPVDVPGHTYTPWLTRSGHLALEGAKVARATDRKRHVIGNGDPAPFGHEYPVNAEALAMDAERKDR